MGEYILNAEAIHQATATNNVLFFWKIVLLGNLCHLTMKYLLLKSS